MKILCIGDIHITLENQQEIELLKNQLIDIITNQEKQIDFVVLLGDVLHTHERLHTLCLNKAINFIETLSSLKELYVLVGNHDYINNHQFLTNNHWLNCLKNKENIHIVDNTLAKEINDNLFYFVPYVPNNRFKEALNKIQTTKFENATCIFAHQEFKNAKMGAIISTDGDDYEEFLPLVISGHIHHQQEVQKNIYYTGTPIQHAFGETEDCSTALLTISNDKTTNIKKIFSTIPKKKIIYTDISELKSFEIPKNIEPNKLKLTLSGSYEEYKTIKKTDKFKLLSSAGVKIVYKQNKIEIKDKKNQIEELKSSNLNFQNIIEHILEKRGTIHSKKLYKNLLQEIK